MKNEIKNNIITENIVKEKMIEYLQNNNWENINTEIEILRFTEGESYQRVDVYAEKNNKTILIECKGDSETRRQLIQDLYFIFGQAVYLLGSDDHVGIAIPSYWKQKLIMKEYVHRIFAQNIHIFLVSEDKIEEF